MSPAPPPSAADAGAFAAHVRAVVGSRTFRFLAATAVALVILVARSPGALVNPLFFAEDRDWTSLIVSRGFWHTVFHARDDYAVFGNALVLWIGIRACDLLAAGDPLQIARWQALTSYLAFAAVISAPVFLLHRRLRPGAILAVWLLAVFMPLGLHSGSWSGFSILGRAANVGFAALYVAFLLAWVRVTTAAVPWKIAALDLGLAACVLTNPITTVVLGAVALPYGAAAWRGGLRSIARAPGIWSLAATALVCLVANGIPAADRGLGPGPVAAPAGVDRLVEYGLARSCLYAVTWPVYRWLSTEATLALAAVVAAALWRHAAREHRWLHAGGVALLAITSLTLVVTRPNIGICLDHYRTTFPDRYFYAQYLVGLPLLAAFATGVAERLAGRGWLARLPATALAGLVALAVCREPPWSISDAQFLVDDDGWFASAAADAVVRGDFRTPSGQRSPDGALVAVLVHPAFQDAVVLLPRDPLVRTLAARRPEVPLATRRETLRR